MTSTSKQDLLNQSCLWAIRSFELSYPSFKPDADVIRFWSDTLMDSNLDPEDIVGGAKLFIQTETNNFNVNLPTLISYCKKVRSKRLKQVGDNKRALVATTEEDIFNATNESEFAKASREAQRVLHESHNPNALKVYNETIRKLHEKYGKPIS